MYMKDMLKDWTFAHFSNCVQYLNCPKENILTLQFEIQEKHELGFFQGFGALEKETSSKKRLEGGKRRGKKQVQESKSKMQDKEDVPTQSQREIKFGLVVASFQEVLVSSIQTIPTKVDDATPYVQKFCSPRQECWRRRQEQTTLGAGTSSIRKRIPLLIPLLISSYVDYLPIVKMMNVSWASILTSQIQTQVWPPEHLSITNFMKEVFPNIV